MRNLSPEVLENIRKAIKRQEGTVEFGYSTPTDLFDANTTGGIIFSIVSGEHYFRLERALKSPEIKFYHSSPGTGTRVASVSLKDLIPPDRGFIAFSWSPKQIQLHIGVGGENGQLISATGTPSSMNFRVAKDGSVVQLGNENAQVMGARINENGQQFIKPTAIDIWNDTKGLIEILLKGESRDGFIFEVVKSNVSIVMMVTGFEAYCKTRFGEIEAEGVNSNDKLIKEKLEKRKENFQDFDGYCKDIFKFGYAIDFTSLVNANEYKRLKQLFKFRSRIVHASPLITAINEFEIPKEKPILSTVIVHDALVLFNMFINELHTATLALRRKD